MAGGFGRKGLSNTTGTAPSDGGAKRFVDNAAGLRNSPRTAPGAAPDDDLARRREAFLEQERARRKQNGSHPAPSYAGEIDRVPSGSFTSKPDRSMMLAYVYWWFAAGAAAHRFYLRAYPSAFAMLGLFWGGLALIAITRSAFPAVFVGAWFVWVIADAFLIPGLTRKANAPQHHLAFT